jgi:hypothetical protein
VGDQDGGGTAASEIRAQKREPPLVASGGAHEASRAATPRRASR